MKSNPHDRNARSKRTVLILDDDLFQASSLVDALQAKGVTVIETRSLQEAFSGIETRGDEIAAVVADMMIAPELIAPLSLEATGSGRTAGLTFLETIASSQQEAALVLYSALPFSDVIHKRLKTIGARAYAKADHAQLAKYLVRKVEGRWLFIDFWKLIQLVVFIAGAIAAFIAIIGFIFGFDRVTDLLPGNHSTSHYVSDLS